MVVWDIGANIGLFAFAAAHSAGPSTGLLAVEAGGCRAGNHLRRIVGSTQAGGAREALRVEAVTLDSRLDRYSPPEAVEIDVEGAEIVCLRGATRLLREVWLVFLCKVAKENADAVGGSLREQGYPLFDAGTPEERRRPFDRPA